MSAELADFYRRALLEDCVPFWFPRSVDRQHGGFLHCFDRDGTRVDTDKSVWAQGRMSWMLLSLYSTVERKPEWLEWAESGLRFLEEHCVDRSDPLGRMFFHVTREGQPIRKRRYAYSEAFAAIAFAAHARSTGSAASALRARELFELFVKWNFTPGLVPPKYTDARPTIGMAPRMITLMAAQELSANLGDDAGLRKWRDWSLDEIERLFVKPDIQCVMETVAPDGEIVDHLEGRMLNPGHAIEAAWFVMREGAQRKDSRVVQLGCRMLEWMWRRGWDTEQGGIFYFRDVFHRPVQEYWHDMKFWWPHDEALIATMMAWKLTRESTYLKWHEQLRAWSFQHFADPEHGEWFGYLRRDGSPSSTLKGNMWKSFFHHPRALWSCWQTCAA
jgi:N-acylglucosamine 2-epimerase